MSAIENIEYMNRMSDAVRRWQSVTVSSLIWVKDGCYIMGKSIKILMEDGILVKENFFFFSRDWNGLYMVELKSGVTQFVSTMPEEGIFAKRLCAGIIYHNNRLIMIPMMARDIWIYDLGNKQWEKVERKHTGDKEHHEEIFRAVEYNNYLFMIGSNYPYIVRMDLNNYELTYLSTPYAALAPFKRKSEAYFRCDFCCRGNRLFLASCLNNFVLCVNLDTLDYEWNEVGENGFCYSGIVWDGENYWLAPRRATPIVKWDGNDGMEYFPLSRDFEETQYSFLGVQYHGGKLIFPGMSQKKTLVINPNDQCDIEIKEEGYLFYRCLDRGVVLFQNQKGLLRIEDSVRNRVHNLYCEIPFEKWISDLKYVSDKVGKEQITEKIWNEVSPSSLNAYLFLLSDRVERKSRGSETGAVIWDVIRS